MTEQQRTARIEFAKKLLVANGFVESNRKISYWKWDGTSMDSYTVKVLKYNIWFSLDYVDSAKTVIPHDYPLKPLRDFIKLSNQK